MTYNVLMGSPLNPTHSLTHSWSSYIYQCCVLGSSYLCFVVWPTGIQ